MAGKSKFKIPLLAAGLALLAAVLVSTLITGDNDPVEIAGPPAETNTSPVEPAANPQPPANDQNDKEDQNLEQKTDPARPQSFAIQIQGLELEVSFSGVACWPLSELALQLSGGKTPEEIQTAFDKYEQGLSNLPQDEAWEIYEIAGSLDYMLNLKNYLAESQSGGPITTEGLYQSLELYKQCSLVLEAKNQGADSSFSNGCGLTIDDYVTATDNQNNRYRPLYLGPGIACTEAEVPFPAGDKTTTGVAFSLPLENELVSITIKDDRSDSDRIVFDLPPTKLQMPTGI